MSIYAISLVRLRRALLIALCILVIPSLSHAISVSQPRNVVASDGLYGDHIRVSWHWGQVMPTYTNFRIHRSEGDYVDCSDAYPIVAHGAFQSHTGDYAHLDDTTVVPGQRYKYAVLSYHFNPVWPDPGIFCSVSDDNPTGSDYGSSQIPAGPVPSASRNSSFSVSTFWDDQGSSVVSRWRLWRGSTSEPCTGQIVHESASRADRSFEDTTAPIGVNVHYSTQAVDGNGVPGLCSNGTGIGFRHPAPVITIHPTPQSRYAGQVVTYAVSANGIQLSYQWQQFVNSGWLNIPGASGSTLSFTAEQYLSGRAYRVLVSNGAGSISSLQAGLTVWGAPTITAHPSNATATVGQSVSFTSGANGEGVQFQWQYRAPGVANWISFGNDMPSAFTRTLAYQSVWIGLNGHSFRMCASNPAGVACSNAAVLTVQSLPIITEHPSNASAFVGESVSFTSAAAGEQLSVRWQFLAPGSQEWAFFGAAMPSAFTTTLTYSGVWMELNAYSFRMCAINPAGMVCSNPAALTVYGAPQITQSPESVTVPEGQGASFSCAASGREVRFSWLRNGQIIEGATEAVYALSRTQVSDSGAQFVCRASNPAGSVESSAATLIVTVPPTPTPPPAPACSDGVDNDADGHVDFPSDHGCLSVNDTDEHNPLVQCDDGVDNDLDGAVDMQDADCTDPTDPTEGPTPQGCTEVNVTVVKQDSLLGPGELRDYALQSLAMLTKAARKADKQLARRLKQSASRVGVKLETLLTEATVMLLNLPDVILVCSDNPACVSVDNSPIISAHVAAVRKLRNQATRALSRATRLVYSSPEEARKKNSAFGRKLRQIGKEIETKALHLPSRLSVCAQ